MGRQLASISGNGINDSFKYNAEGIRTEKTVGTVTTKYHLVGIRQPLNLILGTDRMCGNTKYMALLMPGEV
ncbi:hypothetical protein Q428_13195 [Fervidicella metallireducens AeB]|uniref:Uncharacterized protein n=1 Tax=Fervidicella metallireducens AeB TaxID=1403537 RepID=A0A017RSN3_9CLOT|nr:hypothetical protein [Fervidicella metallireducens]EYE87464.1 hypothetical protein Q428_13195 [Fervidicella metallireducens AeB]